MIYMWEQDLKFAFDFPKSVRAKVITKEGEGGLTKEKALKTVVHVTAEGNGGVYVSGIAGEEAGISWMGAGFIKDTVIRDLERAAKIELRKLRASIKLDAYIEFYIKKV